MHVSVREAGAAIALIVAIAACSGTPASSPTATTEPTPTPTPTVAPTPTPEPTPDLAAIGAEYLAIADYTTATIQPIFDELSAREHTIDEYTSLHQQLVDGYTEIVKMLDAIEFPPELADEVASLRAAWVAIAAEFAKVVDNPDYDADPVFTQMLEQQSVAADAIRAFLGLPPRPTPG
jgi:hypothetical protein